MEALASQPEVSTLYKLVGSAQLQIKNKCRNLHRNSEQQLHGAITKKSQERGNGKGGKGKGGKGSEWTCKHCQTKNRPSRTVCWNSECKKPYESSKAVAAVKQKVTCVLPANSQEPKLKKQKVQPQDSAGAESSNRSADNMSASSSNANKGKTARCKSCHKPWAACLQGGLGAGGN